MASKEWVLTRNDRRKNWKGKICKRNRSREPFWEIMGLENVKGGNEEFPSFL